jgi:hypothetical protein
MSVTYVVRRGSANSCAAVIFSFVKIMLTSSAVLCKRPLGIFFRRDGRRLQFPTHMRNSRGRSSTCSRASLVNSSYVILLIIQESQQEVPALVIVSCRPKGQFLTMLSTRLNSLPQFSHSHVIIGLCFASCRARSFLLENPPSVDCGHPSCRQNNVLECRL